MLIPEIQQERKYYEAVTTSPNRLNAGALALQAARQCTGLYYLYGGTYPGRTDCSGLWEGSYATLGIDISRTTYGEYVEWPIPKSWESEPGDLLFIPGSDPIGREPGHVMGFVSPGRVFAAQETGVRIGEFDYDTTKFEYRTRPALALPMPRPPATPAPTPAQIANRGLVILGDASQSTLALTNGWPVFGWDGWEFVIARGSLALVMPKYANFHFATPRS